MFPQIEGRMCRRAWRRRLSGPSLFCTTPDAVLVGGFVVRDNADREHTKASGMLSSAIVHGPARAHLLARGTGLSVYCWCVLMPTISGTPPGPKNLDGRCIGPYPIVTRSLDIVGWSVDGGLAFLSSGLSWSMRASDSRGHGVLPLPLI